MSRTTWTLDRLATLVVGLALIAAGALAVAWRFDLWGALPEQTDTSQTADATATGWWPWALGVAGVILVLVGLRWLWSHMPERGVGDLNLLGTGDQGRLRFNATAAASTAAEVFCSRPSVRSAKGIVKRDRGQLVVDLRVTVDPDADLGVVAKDSDQIVADLTHVMGRKDLYGRVHLVVASSLSSPSPRVR
ncbi:MAG: hypothetical protein ABJA86_06770 [Nocardioidaceae bacterium]